MLVMLFLAGLANAHEHTAYRWNADGGGFTNRENWMKELPNSISLNRITIPGTHDTATRTASSLVIINDYVTTQALTIDQQLKHGISAFDIRCSHFHDTFPIHHKNFFLNIFFNNVLDKIATFLRTHPSETMIMSVKEESTAAGNRKTFTEVYLEYIHSYRSIFWMPNKINPTLGEVSGKMVVLDEFNSTYNGEGFTFHGIKWEHKSAMVVQDDYKVLTQPALHSKWLKAKHQIIKTNLYTGNMLYMNFLSGAGGVTPYFVASGHGASGNSMAKLWTGVFDTNPPSIKVYSDFPSENCFLQVCSIYYEGTNILAYDYMQKASIKKMGIVYMDFPGDGLMGRLVGLNF